MAVRDLMNKSDWDDSTWNCVVTKGETEDSAECIAYLPSSNSDSSESVYRWSPTTKLSLNSDGVD